MNPAHKEFEKTIRQLTHRHQLWRVFSDFVEMSAIAISNSILKDDAREARYLEIIKAYEPEEQKIFPVLFAITVDALEPIDCDFLGEMFMSLELSSRWHGQFFTPISICCLMSGMVVGDDLEAAIKRKGFVTVQEPACGAGATIIGLAASLRDRKINYQEHVHVTAIDVDATAALMCYVQLALLHVPAVVWIGNTLSLEMKSAWFTPAHHMGFWENKLRRGYALGSEMDGAVDGAPPAQVPEPAEAKPAPIRGPAGQLGFDFQFTKQEAIR